MSDETTKWRIESMRLMEENSQLRKERDKAFNAGLERAAEIADSFGDSAHDDMGLGYAVGNAIRKEIGG